MANQFSNEQFTALFAEVELKQGELRHVQNEALRKLVLFILTKDESQLRVAFDQDPKTYLKLLEYALNIHDHYGSVIELITCSIERLLSITSDQKEKISALESDYEILSKKALAILNTSKTFD